ncbi:hypothetical protein EDD27_4112 [Nonomuraea polychroma]|uniref:Uncharacterized protein n=2 Tax=Nonomuraea polychroma TaxID=46176 RepID=A0A438M760_9ACTN|nr:hypothetical protein EDD27_4112 [Nonomuraea polychroma]
MVPADAIGTVVDLAIKHGPGLIRGILDLFSTQQQGMRPASPVGFGGQGQQQFTPYSTQQQGQQLYPAELVSTLVGLGVTFGPSLVKGILDLFSTQQQGMQPASAGLGGALGQQGQQMVPADVVNTIVDLARQHGPVLLKGILDLFSTQQQGMQPASAGLGGALGQQGQQMVPADVVNTIGELFKRYPSYTITDCFGALSGKF